ncbi:MAG: class I SAM-dependent methyltransferase [Oligoflexia bacterium]|nr:class I SAM-dependent methyltransferase [Oligoflexia bacterium]
MASIKDDRGYNQGYKATPALEIRRNRRCDSIIAEINLESNSDAKTILELGCGTGQLSYLLATKTKAKVIGVDICRDFIEVAKKNYKKDIKNLDYFTLDFNRPEDLFLKYKIKNVDYVVGDGILHHLYYNMKKSLSAINSLLSENGKMIFWEPNVAHPYCFLIFNFSLFRKMASLEPAEKAFSKKFIMKNMRSANFKHALVSYRDCLLPNTPTPLIKPLLKFEKIIDRIPLLNPLLNMVFSQSMFIVGKKKGIEKIESI